MSPTMPADERTVLLPTSRPRILIPRSSHSQRRSCNIWKRLGVVGIISIVALLVLRWRRLPVPEVIDHEFENKVGLRNVGLRFLIPTPSGEEIALFGRRQEDLFMRWIG